MGGQEFFLSNAREGQHFFQKKNTQIPPRRNVPTLNRIRKIVSSAPGKEIEKVVISSCHERGTKKTFRVPISK